MEALNPEAKIFWRGSVILDTSMESMRFELLLTKEDEEGSNQGPVGV